MKNDTVWSPRGKQKQLQAAQKTFLETVRREEPAPHNPQSIFWISHAVQRDRGALSHIAYVGEAPHDNSAAQI